MGIVSRNTQIYAPLTCLDEMDALHKQYRNTEFYIIGKSALEQRIYAMEFGNPDAETRVLVQAGMHGREWINCQIVMAQMEDYLSQEQYAPALEAARFLFVPMCNPDGVRIAQEGAGWIHDKAEREAVQRWIDESGEPFSQWKANGRGVDLNRNFDAHFDRQTKPEEVAGPSAAFYRGPCAESEPETRMLTELTECFHPTVTLSYHSRGNALYWYFFQQAQTLRRDTAFAQALAGNLGYGCALEGKHEVDSFGGYKDYCVEKLGIPAFTIENGAEDWDVPVTIQHFDEIYAHCKDATAFAGRWKSR